MNKLITVAFFVFSVGVFAQTVKLDRYVTNGLDEEITPKISADGNALAFLYKSNRGGKWKIYYTRKKSGKWKRAEELPGINKQIDLVQFAGFTLNEDGSVLYFSSKKYGGVGGYDLWKRERVSDIEWTTPVNLTKPINSIGNECSPSITADGNYMYFTRCSSVTATSSECCEIFVSKRRGKMWGEAKALPSPINTGCERTPFIHPDGKTLYFASKRAGGKGGLDLYMSKVDEQGKWSNPVSLDFINTEKDDQYITMDAREHIMYYSEKKDDTYDIYATFLSEEFKAEPLMKIRLRLKDENGSRVDGFLRIKHPGDKNYLFTKKINDTDYQTVIYLSGKGVHDFTIYGADDNHFFFSEEFNLDSLQSYISERRSVVLATIKIGEEYPIHIGFEKDSVLSVFSKEELQRVKRVVQKHSEKTLELEMRVPVIENSVIQDSLVIAKDTVVGDSIEVIIELTPEEKMLIGKENAIRAFCDQIGLNEDRMIISVKQEEGFQEDEYYIRVK